jgi:hypothetical protein
VALVGFHAWMVLHGIVMNFGDIKKAFRLRMQEYPKGFAHFPIFFIPGSANTLSSESGI